MPSVFLFSLGLLSCRQSGPATIADLDKLAKAKNIPALTAQLDKPGKAFEVLKGGAYEVGVYGWKALEATIPFANQTAVVFTTPMTSQDTGELVFFRKGGKLSFLSEEDNLGVKILSHNINAKFDTATKTASLTDSVVFEKGAAAKDWFLVRFSPCYKMSSVTAGGAPIAFVQVGGVVFIKSPASKKFSLNFTYSGVVNLPNYAGSISPTNVQLTNDYWYPMIARHPATGTISAEIPADWTLVTMGEKVGAEPLANQKQKVTYKLDLPVTYWSFTAAKMNYVGKQIDGLQIGMFSPTVPQDRMAYQSELYAPILRFYQKFGKFPFKGYAALHSPAYGGGALEAYAFATYGGGLPTEDPHEPAHTWWGGMINNTYLRSFWNESFAVFCEGLYARNCDLGNREDRRQAFAHVGNPSPSFKTMACAESGADKGPTAASLGYGKGSHVLAMLEQWIGTEKMIESMRKWIEVHPKGEPGNWEDYEKVVTSLNKDKNIKAFFDSWIRGIGLADVSLGQVSYQDGVLSGNLKWKSKPFAMPLSLDVDYGNGESTRVLIDTSLAPGGAFTVNLPKKPKAVCLDLLHQALREGNEPDYPSFENEYPRFKFVTDPAKADTLKSLTRRLKPASASGGIAAETLYLGHPSSSPQVKELCQRAGFKVDGNKLTYRGQTVDLEKGGAVALVPLEKGGFAAVGLGKTSLPPNTGHASVAIFDEYGRFLAGETKMPTNGDWKPVN